MKRFGFKTATMVGIARPWLLSILLLFAVAVASPPRAQTIQEAMPGTSVTKNSSALAFQSWELAAMVAHLQKPTSCKTAKLIDTKVVSVDERVVFLRGGRLKSGRWSEVWTFDKCGTRVRVRADFKADGRGFADGEFKAM